MQLSLTAVKQDSIWVFDHEHQNTIAEPLCNGTELVMDEYFEIDMKRKPVSGDQMEVFVSLTDFEDSDTVLSFQSTNLPSHNPAATAHPCRALSKYLPRPFLPEFLV